MKVDTVVRNGKVVTPAAILDAGIAIHGGEIVAIGRSELLPEAVTTIDAGGKYVLPGVIDPHVHIGGYHPMREDLRDTLGAALGGVTTAGVFLGLGQEAEKTSYRGRFAGWKETWEENSLIDGFFHATLISDSLLREIRFCADEFGIASFKFFMAYKGEEAAEIGAEAADDGFLWSGFRAIASLGSPARALVHAENIDIIYRLKPGLQATGRQDAAVWDEARPSFCETLDVERAISLARLTGAPLYVVHVHAAGSVPVLAAAKASGVDVIAETTPNYLFLNRDSGLGPLAKIAPALTAAAAAEALWRGLNDGTISCMGTDHCSVTKAMKREMWRDSLPGLPGIATFLPLMLSEGVNKGRITLQKLVEVLSYNTARVFGLYPRKGAIQVGADADLVIVDLEQERPFRVDIAHGGSDYSPFDGWELKGWPVLTMLRGNVLARDGEIVARPGIGRYLPRSVAKSVPIGARRRNPPK